MDLIVLVKSPRTLLLGSDLIEAAYSLSFLQNPDDLFFCKSFLHGFLPPIEETLTV